MADHDTCKDRAATEGHGPVSPSVGLWRRLEAVIVDTWLYTAVALMLTAVLAAPMGDSFKGWPVVWFVLYLGIAGLYEVAGVGRYGSTIGKAVEGLRVESTTDEPLSPARLLARFALGPKVIDTVGVPVAWLLYLLLGGRFLHDISARSRVVAAAPADAQFPVTRSLWLPRLVAAVSAAVLVGAVFADPFRKTAASLVELGVRREDLLLPSIWALNAWGLLTHPWAVPGLVSGLIVACVVAWVRPKTPAAARAGRAVTRMLIVALALYALGGLAVALSLVPVGAQLSQ